MLLMKQQQIHQALLSLQPFQLRRSNMCGLCDFERPEHSEPKREWDHKMEKHPTIELSDREYLEKKRFVLTDSYVKFNKEPYFNDEPLKVSKEMEEAGWVYREPCTVDENSSEYLKQKKALAEALCKETKVITITGNEAPKIEMPIDPDILTKYKISDEIIKISDEIIKGKKNAKSESKTLERKNKKSNLKTNKS